MPIHPNFKSIHEKEWLINFSQCAPNGALNYTDLCNLLQLTASEHSDLGGISFADMQEKDQAWVLSKMRIEIDALPKWNDTIVIKTWIVSLENARSVRALEVYKNGVKLISCETFWVVLNTRIRRPESLHLPHDHCEKFPQMLPTVERVKRIRIPVDTVKLGSHKVVFSDLDIVNHVNNVKYLEWCLDLIYPKLLLKQTIKSLDLNFLNELFLEDEVALFSITIENTTTFSILKEGRSCFSLEFTT
ncbi:acyl-[acyl-carrier-protein] thioesterase [Flavobacterium tegetincola]|uniref:acyl-[acyl-carrier-protein] thioesterase n=1 Tax=Flavobacterium tegetincola TaxID=150172 RepID=UPI000410A33B|nr:acyl-ACP thioesterase domain-containing protein [Flavobacterium tegetincola]